MCYSKEFSMFTLITGILSCKILENLGDIKYNNTNKFISHFFSFVSLMQLIEYLIWNDVGCKNGLNKLSGYLGPLLNFLQPTVIYLLKKDELTDIKNLNFIYVIYILYKYFNLINNADICSKLINGHLKWSWTDTVDASYFIITLINIFCVKSSDFYFNLTFIISFFLLYISWKFFNKNIGEFWCLFVVIIPFIILLIQRIDLIRIKHYK